MCRVMNAWCKDLSPASQCLCHMVGVEGEREGEERETVSEGEREEERRESRKGKE